jgi:hypothetical protein
METLSRFRSESFILRCSSWGAFGAAALFVASTLYSGVAPPLYLGVNFVIGMVWLALWARHQRTQNGFLFAIGLVLVVFGDFWSWEAFGAEEFAMRIQGLCALFGPAFLLMGLLRKRLAAFIAGVDSVA